jgi:hypothetical protein
MTDDDLDDTDMTEEEFDAAFRNGQPVMVVVPVGYRCEHLTVSFTGRANKPTTWCGCKMTPIFADQLTSSTTP